MISTRLLIQKISLTLCLLVLTDYVFSEDFNEKQKTIIYNEAIKILKNYQQYSNQMADAAVDIDELNKISQKLIDQFVSRKAIIYNDLDPTHALSEAYELETYVTNLLLWYPDGMKIYLDFNNLKAGNIIAHGNDIFTVDIMTTKRNDGNYLNKQKNNNTEELLFRVAFFQKNGTFESYKIAGIRSSKTTTLTDDTKLLAEVKSVTFSEKDMQLIKDQTKAILNDYINFLNLLTDPKESTEDKGFYRISFLGLFKDSTQNVANDIEPNPQIRWISVKDYQKNLSALYPDGIRNLGLNIDSAEFGKIIPEGNEKYYFNGYIDKFFSGKYQSKTVFRDNSKYDFKVSFERDENTFKNFRLASIDKFGMNLYSQSSSNNVQELPTKSITSLQRKGLYLGLAVGGGLTRLNDPNLTSSSILDWTISGKTALSAEANATWYFSNKLGISSGLGFSTYNASTKLSGSFRSTNYYTDPNNNETYLKDVNAAYDSLLSFKYISVPITMVYHSNSNPEKWGVFAEAGVVASFNLGSSYQTTGNIETSGYFEQYAQPIIIAPYLDFVKRTNIDNKGKINASGFTLALKAFVGVSYPINYFTTVYAGPELIYNVGSISSSKKTTDAFGTTSSAKNVGISKYGIKFGISYKF